MKTLLEVTYRAIAPSEAIDRVIRERAAKLERFFPRIISCRVIVEQLARRERARALVFHVRVQVRVPEGEFLGDKEPAPQRFHEDVFIAIRDAFDAVGRELEDFARRERGDVKTHEQQPYGHVSKIFPDRGYGFIEGPDGGSVYFHRHSVQNAHFEDLVVGNPVSYVEEDGDNGPQASAVFARKKVHIRRAS